MKNNKYILIIIIILLITLVSSIHFTKIGMKKDPNKKYVDSKDLGGKQSEYEAEIDKIKEKIDSMSYEEKIGQLFILGFNNDIYDDNIDKLIREEKIGGFIFFNRNIKDNKHIKNLNKKIHSVNKTTNSLPIFLAVDEESKTVSRLKHIYGDLPTLEQIGHKNDLNLSYDYGRLLGKRLKNLGFNLNFSPVIDINSNKDNPVINVRSLGKDPYIVSKNANCIINGQNEEGVISCVKHFPGHGDTNIDSHLDIPVVLKTKEELNKMELIPFKKAIDNNIDMIMISHILLPNIDENIASFSSKIMKDILRKEMNYNGVIISDDLTMAASYKATMGNPAVEFILSGGDIALISHDINMYYDAVEELRVIFQEEKNKEILDNKVYRIVKLKYKYLLDNIYIDEYKDKDIIEYTNKLKGRI